MRTAIFKIKYSNMFNIVYFQIVLVIWKAKYNIILNAIPVTTSFQSIWPQITSENPEAAYEVDISSGFMCRNKQQFGRTRSFVATRQTVESRDLFCKKRHLSP